VEVKGGNEILDTENLEELRNGIQRREAENAEEKRREYEAVADWEIGVPAGGLGPAEPFGMRKARRADLRRKVCASQAEFHRLKPVPHGGKFYL
jgi:hypothetical protein